MDVRYRVDGVLHAVKSIPKKLESAMISRIKIMADMDISEKRKPQDGRISGKILGRNVDLRISSLPIQYGERVVLRVLDKQTQQFAIDQLGLVGEDLTRFQHLVTKPYGLILVTGPTGSGKTTTLYSALNHIKSVDTNIMTCEDPIEYDMPGVNQSQVNVKAGLTFAAQLRAILRQDPDVILVGEIRDTETAEIAFQAAVTGHLVFSTLHCNDSPGAVTRLLDMEVEPFLIGSSVIGVLSQRLVRMLCPKCKAPYTPTSEDLLLLGTDNVPEGTVFYNHVGCPSCNQRGYQGRLAVVELMPISSDTRQLIMQRATSEQIKAHAVSDGMRTMRDHAVNRVIEGLTTFDEVRRQVFVEEVD
jgi:type IV pilus assembly protein PilB